MVIKKLNIKYPIIAKHKLKHIDKNYYYIKYNNLYFVYYKSSLYNKILLLGYWRDKEKMLNKYKKETV